MKWIEWLTGHDCDIGQGRTAMICQAGDGWAWELSDERHVRGEGYALSVDEAKRCVAAVAQEIGWIGGGR